MCVSYRSRTSTVHISSTCCNPPSFRFLGRRLLWLWLGRLGLVTASPSFYLLFIIYYKVLNVSYYCCHVAVLQSQIITGFILKRLFNYKMKVGITLPNPGIQTTRDNLLQTVTQAEKDLIRCGQITTNNIY
jgi:hypothetical protein